MKVAKAARPASATMLIAIVVALSSASTRAQQLSDDVVRSALAAGETKNADTLLARCSAGAGFGENLVSNMSGGIARTGGFDVAVSDNRGRIATLSANAKRLYKTLSPADLPADLTASPAMFVAIEPKSPTHSRNTVIVAAPIQHVVLKAKNGDTAVQPSSEEQEPVEWSNLLGAKIEGNRMIARFDPSALKELPAGDLQIVVITAVGERRCSISDKDRRRALSVTPGT